MFESIIKFFQDGGFFMYPILLLGIIGTTIMTERIYMIIFVYYANGAVLMQKIQRLLLDNNLDEAVKICNSKKKAVIYQIFKEALVCADRPIDEIQDHLEVAGLSLLPKLQNRMPYLSTIANVATLLGLLGTIAGLILTFQSLGAVDASQKQQLLSIGISSAMNTTALGLMIAIPCSLVYGYLYNKINTIVDEVEHYSGRLLILLRTGGQYFDYQKKREAA